MRVFLCISVVFLFIGNALAQVGPNDSRTAARSNDGDTKRTAENGHADRAAKAAELAKEQSDLAGAILAAMDTDGDGVVTRIEFGKAMAALRKVHKDAKGNMMVPEKAAAAAAASADGAQQNGQSGQPVAGDRGNAAIARFMQYDRNHDGMLSWDEVPPQARAMLRGADLNGDGKIDAAELQSLNQKMGERMRAWAAGVNPNAGVPGDGGRRPSR
ncbi:MAG TPA: EF-hand domain-containing protein [Lacipirellulaceae bacterium]|nr:EF-hand domain-containing protein [Lacipirellulaceae bacterium]